jgi:hypothetical protein
MMESWAQYLSQDAKDGRCMSLGELGNALNRCKWQFLSRTLNSKLNTEIGGSASPSCVFNRLPAHKQLSAPTEHLSGVKFKQLEVDSFVLQAIPTANFDDETLSVMSSTSV